MKTSRPWLTDTVSFTPIKRHKSVLRFRRSKEHRYERRKVKEWIHRYEMSEPDVD